jgi:hypothetical protein
MDTSELDLLAQAAAATLVTAATSDAWGKAKKMIARVLGHGNAANRRRAENQLEETRSNLANAPITGQSQARAAEQDAWQEHIADFLAARPEAETALQHFVTSIRAELRTARISASGHGQAIGQVSINAPGGIAAWKINGKISFSTPSPSEPPEQTSTPKTPPLPI